jgi:hypothetical protein
VGRKIAGEGMGFMGVKDFDLSRRGSVLGFGLEGQDELNGSP